jgi:hypothetical protein
MWETKTVETPVELIDRRDFFVAHAPPLPPVVYAAYVEHLQQEDPDAMNLPWNEGVLRAIARQEARWRSVFADEMIRELDRKFRKVQSDAAGA